MVWRSCQFGAHGVTRLTARWFVGSSQVYAFCLEFLFHRQVHFLQAGEVCFLVDPFHQCMTTTLVLAPAN